MSEKLYKFQVDCGYGSLESVFTATQEQIDWITGQYIYFGEVLGKNSEVHLEMKTKNFTVLSEDTAFVQQFSNIVGVTGECPFNHLDGDQVEKYDELFPEEEQQ